ncbi:zinc metalloprotease [Edaphocola flava]|uniref:hypothetical protein n=1 Tax=Edaphocola flava TaxID=2499629 RepID=UPI00100B0ABA|nr:hypothetical protein [Edaphocola flava]
MLERFTENVAAVQLHHNQSEERYFIEFNNNFFLISEFTFGFIEYVKKNPGINYGSIGNQFQLSPEETTFIVENLNNEVHDIISTEHKSSVKLKITLLNARYVNIISDKLKFLIRPSLLQFIIGLLAVVAMYIGMYYYLKGHITKVTGVNYYILYPIFLCTLIIHELGHSVATKRFNLAPREIGFGLFFILPVLYSNISCIWVLNKEKRIIVNLSGIFFQLFFTLVMSIIFFAHKEFLFVLYNINIAVIFFSLFPFIKTDGYWVLSDFFGKPNLFENSNQYLYKLFKKEVKFDLFYFFYSIAHFIFIFYVLSIFIRNMSGVLDIDFHNITYISLFKGIYSLIFVYFLINSIISKFKS